MPSREGCRVFLGNLPYSVRERDIERFFERYGRVYNIFIKSGKYGFCEFDDYRDADDAVYKLNGCELNSERITVEHARGGRRAEGRSSGGSGGGGGGYRGDRYRGRGGGRGKYGPPTRTNYRVIVENLSTRVSWQDLKDVMRRAGEVTFADAHNDKRNEGVVEFISRRDMERAIDKFDNHELHGRRIRLVRDRSTSRSRSRSGSRSSYSRSRSRSSSRSRSRSYERKRRSRSCDSDEQRSRRRRSRESNERRRSRSSSADSHKEEYRSSPPRDNGKRSRSPEENGNDDSHTKRHRRSESLDRRDDMSDEGRNSVPPPGEAENPPPPGDGDE
uniref:Serinearginine protein 55like [Acyrthosiphon pisum] n=1 Tax=Lepeophtheirus salmonis TaxID=72036 RepID=A0A0K2V2F3_LEPSM